MAIADLIQVFFLALISGGAVYFVIRSIQALKRDGDWHGW